MAVRFDIIELSSTGHHAYPFISGVDNAQYLNIQTQHAYVHIGANNSSYAHFYTNAPSYYFNQPVRFDGNIQGYGGDETASFATYYDLNNSAYYVNPAGTSSMNDINIDDYIVHGGDTDTYFGFGTSDSIRFVAGNSEILLMTGNTLTVGDGMDDKAIIHGHLGIGNSPYPKVAYPGQNALWSGSGSTTGQIVIDLPGTLTNYDMMYMEIDIYEYSGDAATKLIVGGHNWNSGGNSNTSTTQWYNVNVQVVGRLDKPIYVGRRNDGTSERRCIAIGETTSTWSYATVHVHKVHGAEFYSTAIDWVGDWNIAQTTSTSYFTKNPTTNFNANNSYTLETNGIMEANMVYGTSSVRSPIFYDLDDTNYYIDLASTSTGLKTAGEAEVKSLRLGNGFTLVQGGSTYARLGSWIDVNLIGLYSSNANGNGAHFYPNTSATYGSWRINGARNNWNGIAFAGTSSTFNTIMSESNGATMGLFNDTEDEWYIRCVRNNTAELYYNGVKELQTASGYTLANNQMRSPIFYDSGNTAYYLDPSSSTSLNVVGTISSAAKGHVLGANNATAQTAVLELKSVSGAEQLRLTDGDSLGTSWGPFVSFYDGGGTRRGYVQGKGTSASAMDMRVVSQHGSFSVYTDASGGLNERFLVGSNGSAVFRGDLTGESYIRALASYQITLDAVHGGGPVIEFGATNDYDAYGHIGQQGGEYQFGTHSRDFAWYQGTTRIMELDHGGANQEPVLAIGWNVAADNTKGTLQVFGHNNTDGTVRLGPHSSKGSTFSHIHYGSNGDWYIRPASNSGSVFVLNYSAISDERLKENIVDSEYGLSEITSLRPRNFNWIGSSTDDVHTGFVAQEVEAVVSKWITQGELDDHKSVDYNAITATLVKAVQELKAENEDLLNRVKALENK